MSPPPPSTSGPVQISLDDQVRKMWDKYMFDHKIKNLGTNPDSIHFDPWGPVGEVMDVRPRQGFRAKPGMKIRIRLEKEQQ